MTINEIMESSAYSFMNFEKAEDVALWEKGLTRMRKGCSPLVVPCATFERITGIKLTHVHTGKMKGLKSLSTSCLCNPFCLARMKNQNSICSHCFSAAMQNGIYKKSLPEKLAINALVLTSVLLPIVPHIETESGLFRFESFGDLINETQTINYFHIARANKHLQCALWTKNPEIIERTISQFGTVSRPSNLELVLSSNEVNKINHTMIENYNYRFDRVFTVYDKQHAETVGINCGARSCATCRKCYTIARDFEYINELLK